MHFESRMDNMPSPDYLPAKINLTLIIYADGSCYYKTGEGAYAARIEYRYNEAGMDALHYVWGHLDGVTNNIAELLAIYNGLIAVPERLRKDATVLLYSDSEWAIRCLNGEYKPKMYHDDPLINWNMIHGAASTFRLVKFMHTKGHAGTLGNEECDTLCEYARKNIPITPSVFKTLMAQAKAKSRD